MTVRSQLRGVRLGVLGGMGPLASAEFVGTIYRLHRGAREQSAPEVLLYSNPRVPDRTATLLDGEGDVDALLAELVRGLELLLRRAERVVVCCFTIHHLMDRLPPHLRQRVVSLVDVALEVARETPGRLLVGCTRGTRRLGVFHHHPAWSGLDGRAIFPDDPDLERLHHAVYRVKSGRSRDELATMVVEFAEKYQADHVMAGCTELHLVAEHFDRPGSPVRLLDPLTEIARALSGVSGASEIQLHENL